MCALAACAHMFRCTHTHGLVTHQAHEEGRWTRAARAGEVQVAGARVPSVASRTERAHRAAAPVKRLSVFC